MTTYRPLRELTLARLREFLREPEALFWTYGFPPLLAVGLGIAFREQPVEIVHVDVQQGPGAADLAARLSSRPDLVVSIRGEREGRERLRMSRSAIVVVPGDPVTYVFDPGRPESALARARVDDALLTDNLPTMFGTWERNGKQTSILFIKADQADAQNR